MSGASGTEKLTPKAFLGLKKTNLCLHSKVCISYAVIGVGGN